MKKLFFIFVSANFISCSNFDCVSKYNGQVVVDTLNSGYVLSNGCDYTTVKFPALYKYSLGDTIGKTKHTDRLKLLETQYKKEMDILRKLKRDYYVKLMEREDYYNMIKEDLNDK